MNCLVTKFSIKVTDLIKYLEISKATIYNYRNLEKFSDIPKDKQLKIFYLFGKESEQELELVLDEADPDILAGYLSRISSILKGSYNNKLQSLSSIEELTEQVERLTKENDSLKRQVLELLREKRRTRSKFFARKQMRKLPRSAKMKLFAVMRYTSVPKIRMIVSRM